jgi:hypothetical protein
MKRYSGSLAVLAFGGCIAVAAAGAVAQSGESSGQRRTVTRSSNSSGDSSSGASNSGPSRGTNHIRPLPDAQRVPMPAGGGRTPLGGSGGLPDVPSGAERRRNAPPAARDEPAPQEDVTGNGPYDAIRHANDVVDQTRRRHGLGTSDDYDRDRTGRDGYGYGRRGYRRPYYYDYPYGGYDNYRPYGYGYPPYNDPYRYNQPLPQDYGYDNGYGFGGVPPKGADQPGEAAPAAGLGLLPPDGLMDEDLPPALRKAVDASPQYREAMAQLLRAWADYARAADAALSRLRNDRAYQKALADLREAEAKVANLRDRGANVPAVNLHTAAQQAMLARRAVRAQEDRAIDADPNTRRAKQQLEQAVERRDKIRDEIAAKLPPEQKN